MPITSTATLAIDAPDPQHSDQAVLRVLKAGVSGALLNLIETDQEANAVYHFQMHMLSGDQVMELLVPLAERRASELTASWPQGDAPGLVPVWRMWLRRIEPNRMPVTEAVERLTQSIRIAATRNLWLAAEIDHYFVSATEVAQWLRDRATAVRQVLHDVLRTGYAGAGLHLANALRGAPPFALLQLCFGLDSLRSELRDGEPLKPLQVGKGLSTLSSMRRARALM
jgi:hypothetical protein